MPKKRAIAKPGLGIGAQRYRLYRRAWLRVKEAKSNGYCLEAITLLESLITDRLESRASYLTKENIGFVTMGQVVARLQKLESADAWHSVLQGIDSWRGRRNVAIHEMVKFEEGQIVTWHDKSKSLQEIVEQGEQLLLAYDTLDRNDRKKNGARPAATEPAAFH